MNEHLDIWMKARARIADSRNWCQNTIAVTADGLHTGVDDPKATAWCWGGAMILAAGDKNRAHDAMQAFAATCNISPVGFPGQFNDTHSHQEVLALLDRGIALARATRSLPLLVSQLAPPAPAKELV